MKPFSIPHFTPKGFSHTIFRDRYAFTESETWEEACLRLARQMAIPELPEKQQYFTGRFYESLVTNQFVPGGRIWTNAGRQNPNMLNCFVLTNDLDSAEGWGSIAYQTIVTSMRGGGCGIEYSSVRPRGAAISTSRGMAPGPVELMKLVDNCAEPIRAGGQRRAALLFSLDLDHPDIEEFLNAKLVRGELSHANISVRSKHTKDFITAIKDDTDIELHWRGKYKRHIKARVLWRTIVDNAYNCAEPGFLNWELVESENPISYHTELSTCNPCGEQPLNPYSSCCLGHIVLTRFVDGDTINYPALGDAVRLAVRFLDNVLSVNHFPLPEMKTVSDDIRRIGLGTTALADTLAMLGHRYGSEEGNKFISKLYRFISKAAYEASVLLAIEKGPFPKCQPLKHIETGFVKRMPEKIKSLIGEHGLRNSCILTQAPTGTVSILSDNCSSGIEPMFAPAYERRYWVGDVRKAELVFHPLFERFMQEGKPTDHFVGSYDLTVRDHLEVQKIIQHHVDSALSKTINLPYDYPIEDMEKLWLEYLPHLKGTTFYREKTRGYINAAGEVEEPPLTAISLKDAKKRFKETHTTGTEAVVECPSGVCQI